MSSLLKLFIVLLLRASRSPDLDAYSQREPSLGHWGVCMGQQHGQALLPGGRAALREN